MKKKIFNTDCTSTRTFVLVTKSETIQDAKAEINEALTSTKFANNCVNSIGKIPGEHHENEHCVEYDLPIEEKRIQDHNYYFFTLKKKYGEGRDLSRKIDDNFGKLLPNKLIFPAQDFQIKPNKKIGEKKHVTQTAVEISLSVFSTLEKISQMSSSIEMCAFKLLRLREQELSLKSKKGNKESVSKVQEQYSSYVERGLKKKVKCEM